MKLQIWIWVCSDAIEFAKNIFSEDIRDNENFTQTLNISLS